MQPRPRSSPTLAAPLFLALATSACAMSACGSSKDAAAPASAETIPCPAPTGPVTRENCTAVGAEFDVLSVNAARKSAGSGPEADARIKAIEAADALASALKQQRLALCEQSNACKVAPNDHAARDRVITDRMSTLIKLWDERKFTDPTSVSRFHEAVLALHRTIDPTLGGTAPAGAPTAAVSTNVTRVALDTLMRLESPAVAFKVDAGVVTITVKDEASHDVLRGPSVQVGLTGGKRYLIKLTGSYTPAAAPLLAPGDEVTVRIKYRAAEASELYAALRSLEDPDSTEATTSWALAAGDKGNREVTLTAPPGASGPYVGIGVRGTGSVEIDDVELVRGGKVLAAARAEVDAEPLVKTSCTPVTTRPIAGKRSLRCAAGAGDRLTLGLPSAHIYAAVREPSAGERAVLRTLSLEGDRSLDATLTENGDLIVGLSGPGTATLKGIEISTLTKQ